MSIATETIKWIESTLKIPSGQGRGESVRLFDWQKKFIRGAFDPGVSTAALTVARGNGKTHLIAFIMAAALDMDGPLHDEMSELLVLSASHKQGRVVYRAIMKMLDCENDRPTWRLADSTTKCAILNQVTYTELAIHGAKAGTLHGYGPRLMLLDEMAKWEPRQVDDLYDACETSLGKHPDGRLLAVGTRPNDDQHRFSRLLDGEADYTQRHEYRGKAWLGLPALKKSNPSWKEFPALFRQIDKERKSLKSNPEPIKENSYREYRLNQGAGNAKTRRLLDIGSVKRIERPETTIKGPYVLSVDLSDGVDMAACSAVTIGRPDSFRHHAQTFAVWPDNPPLKDRAKSDGVGKRYESMQERGELVIVEGRIVKPEHVINEAVRRWGWPETIVGDRWRARELLDLLEPHGFSEGRGWQPHGQGFKDMGESIRRFQQMAGGDDLAIPESVLLRDSFGAAELTSDPAGNLKFQKPPGNPMRRRRDDPVVSLVMASAEVSRLDSAPQPISHTYHVPLDQL